MRMQDIMSKNVISVSPQTDVAAARQKLRTGEIDHLVMVDGKRVVGVVSGRDLPPADDDKPVRVVMTQNVATIEPGATLRRAAGIMRGRAVGCLPVVDDGRLVGIVTTSDLLTALAKGEIHTTPPKERVILRKRGPRKRSIPV
jgi:acetoin utilization protein AcuB